MEVEHHNPRAAMTPWWMDDARKPHIKAQVGPSHPMPFGEQTSPMDHERCEDVELTDSIGTGIGILVPITVNTIPNAVARLNGLDGAAGSGSAL